jgi:predicted RND superfamily exporter protein
MKRMAFHSWTLRHPIAVVSCFFVLSAVFLWGNTKVEKGGILDRDVILRADDPFYRMDQYVHSKTQEGFSGREFIPFVLHRGVHSQEDAEKILRLTRAAQDAFGETILSLAITPMYQDTGEALLDAPYVNDNNVAKFEEPAHVNSWEAQAASDAGVFGLLVGRDFSWTAVTRYLPPGYDEIKEFRRTVEFLEGRSIPWWEWLWKKDIHPQDPQVAASGWTMGRGLIDQGLNVDILELISLGIVLTLPIFWLTLGSLRAACLGVGVMVMGGFVWTRGAMGLLGVPERVFSLLAYASVIVQGTSFALHKFAALEESDQEDRREGWLQACEVDELILTTAAISAFGFATLWSFGLTPIRELGISATIGVVWLLLLAVVFLPAFDMLTASQTLGEQREAARWSGPRDGSRRGLLFALARLARKVIVWCEQLCVSCVKTALWLSRGARPRWILLGTTTLFAAVAWIFWSGGVQSHTRALEFIRGTSVAREARFLNQAGNIGFEFLDLLVEPQQGTGLKDPQFLARAWELQTRIKAVPGSRETSSILGTVRQIARESFKKTFPETTEEVAAAFFLIESHLALEMQPQLYFPGGVRISVSYGTDDSVELGRFRDAVLALAHQSFPDLKVSAFNKAALYPQVDKYVREGKIANIFTSQIGIALLCGVLLWRSSRRFAHPRLAPLWGGLVMSLPLLFATGMMGLLMWGLQIPLDMATASIGALAINAATDFSLYLVLTYQKKLRDAEPHEALRKTLHVEGKVILADCLLNACCFLPLMGSRFLPVQQLGWMMGVMLAACAVGSLLLMAALLPACVTEKERSHEKEFLPLHSHTQSDAYPIVWVGVSDGTRSHRVSTPTVESPC